MQYEQTQIRRVDFKKTISRCKIEIPEITEQKTYQLWSFETAPDQLYPKFEA